jgi:hypothetical protein
MGEKIPPELREDVAALLRSLWWAKCLLATEHDLLGLILRAAMAMPTDNPPWLGPSAIIDPAGLILSNYVDKDNHLHFAAVVCHIEDLVRNLQALIDQEGLTFIEAETLMNQVKAWIKSDARPETEQPEDRIPIEYRRLN